VVVDTPGNLTPHEHLFEGVGEWLHLSGCFSLLVGCNVFSHLCAETNLVLQEMKLLFFSAALKANRIACCVKMTVRSSEKLAVARGLQLCGGQFPSKYSGTLQLWFCNVF